MDTIILEPREDRYKHRPGGRLESGYGLGGIGCAVFSDVGAGA